VKGDNGRQAWLDMNVIASKRIRIASGVFQRIYKSHAED